MPMVHAQLGGRRVLMGIGYGVVIVGLGLVSGCIPESKPGFDSPAPSKRLDAIVDASGLEDDESLVKLVEKLRSYDPAERMFAIRSLQIRTGETLGYDHAGHDWKRLEAFTRWVDYLEERGIDISGFAADMADSVDDGESGEETPMDQDGDE